MRAPAVTEENLANQIAVVKEEIRVNVLNRALRRLPLADPAAGAVRHLPQRPQRLRRLRGPGERHRRRRPRLLRPLLRPGQRGARASAATSRPSTRLELVQRHFGDVPRRTVPAAPRLRRAGADHASAAPSTSTRSRRLRRSRWAGGSPTLTTSTPTCRTSCCARCSRPATPRGCAGGWCRRTGSPATSALTSAFMEDAFDVRNPTALLLEAHHRGRRADRPGGGRRRRGARPGGHRRGARRRAGAGAGPAGSALLQGAGPRAVADAGDGVVRAAARPGRAGAASCRPCSAPSPASRSPAAAALAPDARARLDLVPGGAR